MTATQGLPAADASVLLVVDDTLVSLVTAASLADELLLLVKRLMAKARTTIDDDRDADGDEAPPLVRLALGHLGGGDASLAAFLLTLALVGTHGRAT